MKPAPPTMAVYWQGVVTKTATGKVVRRTRKYRARSFHVAFLTLLRRYMFDQAQSAIDIGGTSRSLSTAIPVTTSTVTGFDLETEGIGCGTSAAAIDATDFYLTTPIVEGTGAGELTYGNNTTSIGAVASGTSITSMDLVRPIANSSGGTITVEEICLVVSVSISASPRGFMLIRDLTGGIAVQNGETLTITYTLKTTA